MENQTILKTMHDFLDYVEGLQGERDLLQVQLSCAEKRLAKLDNASQEQQPDYRWFSVKEEEPEDGERVVVMTTSGNTFMYTYDSRCGFMTEAVAWLKLPEYN